MARDPVPAEDQGVADVPIPISGTEVKPKAPSALFRAGRGEQVPAQAGLLRVPPAATVVTVVGAGRPSVIAR